MSFLSRSRARTRQVRDARRALQHSDTYTAYQAAADELDALLGLDAWRGDDESRHYHADTLRRDIQRFEELKRPDSVMDLVEALHESLHRNLNDVLDPGLYNVAHGGTKHLVGNYLDAAEQALRWLTVTDFRHIPVAAKRAEIERASKAFGRSALMLSGGATLGFFHLGVTKALFEHDLLPDVLSGASTGAMVASGVCCRTDEELEELFGYPENVERFGLEFAGFRNAWRNRALLRPERLFDTIQKNCGNYTFGEAHERSGRTLNISVSPTRKRQKPRILNHITSPNVLVASGALASSALPLLFPAAQLMRRKNGKDIPYIPDETWIDGSMVGDLPQIRLSRLHNVNHFIVSQTNPHILPFIASRNSTASWTAAIDLASTGLRANSLGALRMARHVAGRSPVSPLIDQANALLDQAWRGDIDIHPAFRPGTYARVVANPTLDELKLFIREGERATFPRLDQIRQSTRIARTFSDALRTLEAKVAQAHSA